MPDPDLAVESCRSAGWLPTAPRIQKPEGRDGPARRPLFGKPLGTVVGGRSGAALDSPPMAAARRKGFAL